MRDITPDQLQSEVLDDFLSRWHHYVQVQRYGRGWNDKSAVTGDFRTSRQYDDQNGALDLDIEKAQMRVVDFEVSEMRDPWKAAIHANARALVAGCAIFSSARLPLDREMRNLIISQARAQLTTRLQRAGMM